MADMKGFSEAEIVLGAVFWGVGNNSSVKAGVGLVVGEVSGRREGSVKRGMSIWDHQVAPCGGCDTLHCIRSVGLDATHFIDSVVGFR